MLLRIYCNSPYINPDCGHCDGYAIEDYEMFLKFLSSIEGKFLLSSFPNPLFEEYRAKKGLTMQKIEIRMPVDAKSENRKATKLGTTAFVPIIRIFSPT